MAGIRVACEALVAATLRGLRVAVGLVALAAAPALAFDFARYQPADLDDILAQPRPTTGLDLHRANALRLEVTLLSYEETCGVEAIRPVMRMIGFSKEMIDNVQAS